MFEIFRRKPKNVDEALNDLAVMLWEDNNNPTYKRELIDSKVMDFSLESLRHLDDYLDVVHADQPNEETLLPLALRCGAYVGEVIRRNSNQEYHWYDYKSATKLSNLIKGLGMELGTSAILMVNAENLCFPISKVIKYIDNGKEDSVYFFAEIGINGIPE